MTLDTTRYNKT